MYQRLSLSTTARLFLVAGLALLAFSSARAGTGIGNIQGTITDENGKPVVGAGVQLVGVGAPVNETTDSHGSYAFTGIQPGTYTVKAADKGYTPSESPVAVLLDTTSELDFELAPAVASSGKSTIHLSPIARESTSSTTIVSERIEQLDKSQPNNLYQQTGLLNYQPGITVDSGQYPHVRGSDENATDYEIDGISVRDPISNQFATDLVTEGMKSTDIVTGGDDASYDGATGGYVNSTTENGRDLMGGSIEYTTAPGAWHYSGGDIKYGNTFDNGKFDYEFANIDFSTQYPGNTEIAKLNSSQDESIKVNDYADSNDTYTAYLSHGGEDYWYTKQGASDYKYEPNTPTVVNGQTVATSYLDPNAQPRAMQVYDFGYGMAKHNFTDDSYLTYRIYKILENIPYYFENFDGEYVFERTQIVGNQLEYYNRISTTNTLRLGTQYLDKQGSYEYLVTGISAPISGTKGYNSRYYPAAPNETIEYSEEDLHTPNQDWTANLGVRADQATFNVKQDPYINNALEATAASYVPTPGYTNYNAIDGLPSNFSKEYVDPRLGLAYSPTPSFKLTTSYSVNSQLPDLRRVEYLTGAASGRLPTTTDPQGIADSLVNYDTVLNKLGPQHSNDFDLGFVASKTATGLLNGKYQLSVTGFKKYTYDMTQLNYQTFDFAHSGESPSPLNYTNGGHMHSSGAEVSFQKAQVHQGDWNGFLSYTNEVVRATNTYYDGTYEPYFAESESGNPSFYDSSDPTSVAAAAANGVTINGSNDFRVLNNDEFPTSYDQRHSVSVLVNKRINNLFEETVILDAGSGYPISSSSTSDAQLVGAVDGQHAAIGSSLGGIANFGEVPIFNPSNSILVPVNPVVGYTGWHFKFAINSTLHVSQRFSLFVNADNVFDRLTTLVLSTGQVSGAPYYTKPTAQFPEGKEYFGPSATITPIFLSFGFKEKF